MCGRYAIGRHRAGRYGGAVAQFAQGCVGVEDPNLPSDFEPRHFLAEIGEEVLRIGKPGASNRSEKIVTKSPLLEIANATADVDGCHHWASPGLLFKTNRRTSDPRSTGIGCIPSAVPNYPIHVG